MDSTGQEMGNKTSYEEERRKKKQETGWVGGIYIHDVCDPQGRGLSPSLGCQGRTLTKEDEQALLGKRECGSPIVVAVVVVVVVGPARLLRSRTHGPIRRL